MGLGTLAAYLTVGVLRGCRAMVKLPRLPAVALAAPAWVNDVKDAVAHVAPCDVDRSVFKSFEYKLHGVHTCIIGMEHLELEANPWPTWNLRIA